VSTRGPSAPKQTTTTVKPAPKEARGARASAMVEIDPAELAAKKLASPAQLLFRGPPRPGSRAARSLDRQALRRVEAKTGLVLRPAHTALFPHVDLEGTRPTELARRLGVSKQAVHPLVEELVAMGVFERAPDPRDARATLVRWSNPRGRSLLDGLAALGELERELAAVLGARRLRELGATLRELDAWLDREGASS